MGGWGDGVDRPPASESFDPAAGGSKRSCDSRPERGEFPPPLLPPLCVSVPFVPSHFPFANHPPIVLCLPVASGRRATRFAALARSGNLLAASSPSLLEAWARRRLA
jgi:hypothetical protein